MLARYKKECESMVAMESEQLKAECAQEKAKLVDNLAQ